MLIDGSCADFDGWPAEVTPAGGTKAFAPAMRKAIPIVAMDRFVRFIIVVGGLRRGGSVGYQCAARSVR